jgi:hypothetical protein
VYLHKIKAHSRNIGNIKADKAAKQASQQSHDTLINIMDGSAPHASKYWPHAIITHPESGRSNIRELVNLHHDLKTHMHIKHHLGNSNTESVYFKAWTAIAPTVNKKASNHFMTSTKTTDGQKRIALSYRTGTLMTNKWKHRMDPTHTDKCPLCGLTDGGHHALSGCPIIAQKIGALRHNAAGRHIMKAISKGSRGADLIMADVGRKSLMEEAELVAIPHRIPKWILTQPTDNWLTHSAYIDCAMDHEECVVSDSDCDMQENHPTVKARIADVAKHSASITNRLIPDGLLLSNGCKGKIKSNTEFTIIEIKYCSDTQPEGQKAKAAEQHAELCQRLAHLWSCKVTLHTILLGVGGTIYTKMEDTMNTLGVQGEAFTKLANDLNHIAVEYAQNAMALRTALTQPSRKSTTIPIYKGGGKCVDTTPLFLYSTATPPPLYENPILKQAELQTNYRNGDPD